MPDLVIADTSCIIVLTKIDELDLLRQTYHSIWIPPEVAREYNRIIPNWISIESPSEFAIESVRGLMLDPGELSAIALATELPDSLLMLDDNDARKAATALRLRVTGTLGVVIAAKQAGILNSVIPVFEKIRATDFYVSEEIFIRAIKEAGE